MNQKKYLEKLVEAKQTQKIELLFRNFREIDACPVTETMNFIGGKWKPIILYLIDHDVNRFGELSKLIAGISKKILTEQLRELEKNEIIKRKIFPGKLLKIEYSLTAKGETLMPVIGEMCRWGLSTR